MKIIHTADWHLGQTFAEYNREAEHERFLGWLIQLIKTQEVDLLLIAGDIFDSSNPPAYAQKMYYTFLHQCTRTNPKLQIIITAGNHDSAARLEAPEVLLESMNISVRGLIRRKENNEIDFDHLIIPLKAGGYCMAIPYLRQGEYPKSKSYVEGIQNMYKEVFLRTQEKVQNDSKKKFETPDNTGDTLKLTAVAPIIAMGHLMSSGAQFGSSKATKSSKEDTNYEGKRGGLEQVSAETFDTQIAYTALGHIHRHQSVGGRDNIRYSGAPLPMSFAEINNKQGVELITIEAAPVPQTPDIFSFHGDSPLQTTIERILYDSPVHMLNLTPKAEPKEIILEAIKALEERPTAESEHESSTSEDSVEPSSLGNAVQKSTLFGEADLSQGVSQSVSVNLSHNFWPFLKINVALTEPEPSLKYQIEEALKTKAVRLAQIHASTNTSRLKKPSITYEKLKSIQPLDMALEVFQQNYGGADMPEAMQSYLHQIIDEVNDKK